MIFPPDAPLPMSANLRPEATSGDLGPPRGASGIVFSPPTPTELYAETTIKPHPYPPVLAGHGGHGRCGRSLPRLAGSRERTPAAKRGAGDAHGDPPGPGPPAPTGPSTQETPEENASRDDRPESPMVQPPVGGESSPAPPAASSGHAASRAQPEVTNATARRCLPFPSLLRAREVP